MPLKGCTFVKLLKAEGIRKVLLYFLFKKKKIAAFFRMATPPPRFSFQIRLSGI